MIIIEHLSCDCNNPYLLSAYNIYRYIELLTGCIAMYTVTLHKLHAVSKCNMHNLHALYHLVQIVCTISIIMHNLYSL